MSEKSEALRLADALDECKYVDVYRCKQAAAELRRLHELALEQQGKIYALEMARSMEQKTAKLKQDALRAELKEATEAINDPAVNNLRTLPESIRVLCAQRDALLEALEEIHQATMKNKVVIAKYIGINFLAAIAIRKAKEGK